MISHQLPDAPFSFYTFVFARLVVGLGDEGDVAVPAALHRGLAQLRTTSMSFSISSRHRIGAALGFLVLHQR